MPHINRTDRHMARALNASAFLFAAALFLWPAQALAKDPEKEICDKTVLHLGEGVERIQWEFPGLYGRKVQGVVVYRDGRRINVRGDHQRLCDLEPDREVYESRWLTLEERGLDAKFLSYSQGKNADDTEGTAEADSVDETSSYAWFSNRTTILDRPVIGRGYHLTRLVIHTNKTDRNRFVDLPSDRVFMSRYVNPFSLNLHGNHHPVGMALIEGHVAHGPALSVYGYFEGRLQLLARTPWHGDRHGWMVLVKARDLDRDGCPELAVVRDPQDKGMLEVWELRHELSPDGTPFRLVKRAEAQGFSNHVFGTASTRISLAVDADRDGIIDLIVPDRTRKFLRVMSLKDGRLEEVRLIALPAPIAHDLNFFHATHKKVRKLTLVVPLEDSTIRLVKIDVPRVPYKRSSESCAAAYKAPGQR